MLGSASPAFVSSAPGLILVPGTGNGSGSPVMRSVLLVNDDGGDEDRLSSLLLLKTIVVVSFHVGIDRIFFSGVRHGHMPVIICGTEVAGRGARHRRSGGQSELIRACTDLAICLGLQDVWLQLSELVLRLVILSLLLVSSVSLSLAAGVVGVSDGWS